MKIYDKYFINIKNQFFLFFLKKETVIIDNL